VTRAEAAAILARLVAGRNAADSLPAAATGFVDVPASHWASKYIAYCVAQGYVAGYGNRRFGPNDNVTSSQFAAMLLRAVGYGKLGEFEGALWETNAIVLGMREKILEGDKNFSAPASRDETAQYAFKALTDVHMVDLSADRTNYIPRERKAPDPFVPGQFVDAPVAIMDNIYPQLVARRSTPVQVRYGYADIPAQTVADLYGRPSTRWIYAGVEIGLYPFKPIATFTAGLGPTDDIRRTAVLNAVGSGYAFSGNISVYFNGDGEVGNWVKNPDFISATATPAEPEYIRYRPDETIKEALYDSTVGWNYSYDKYVDIVETNRNTIAAKIGLMAENGVQVELFISYPNTSYATIDVVTVTQTDLYQVVSASATNRQVNLKPACPVPVNGVGNVLIRAIDNEELYDVVKDCKTDDFVLLTMGYKNAYIPADLYIPESVTGVIQARTSTAAEGGRNRVTTVTLTTGTRYSLGWRNGALEDLAITADVSGVAQNGVTSVPGNQKDESILYLDKYGYLVCIEAAAPPPTAFIYVLEDVGVVDSNGISRAGIRGVLASGEEVIVRASGSSGQGIYTYGIKAGVYELTDAVKAGDAALDLPVPSTPGGPANAKTYVDIESGAIKGGDLRLTYSAVASVPPTTPGVAQNGVTGYTNLYASNVKFIYIKGTGSTASFTVREGVQKADGRANGLGFNSGSVAVIESRAGVAVVTAVFLIDETPGATDPNSIIYISGRNFSETAAAGPGLPVFDGYIAWGLPGKDADEFTTIFVDDTTPGFATDPVGFYTYSTKEVGTLEKVYNLFPHTIDNGKTAVTVSASPTSLTPIPGQNRLSLTGGSPSAPGLLDMSSVTVVDTRSGPPLGDQGKITSWNELEGLIKLGGMNIKLSIMYDDSKATRLYVQTFEKP